MVVLKEEREKKIKIAIFDQVQKKLTEKNLNLVELTPDSVFEAISVQTGIFGKLERSEFDNILKEMTAQKNQDLLKVGFQFTVLTIPDFENRPLKKFHKYFYTPAFLLAGAYMFGLLGLILLQGDAVISAIALFLIFISGLFSNLVGKVFFEFFEKIADIFAVSTKLNLKPLAIIIGLSLGVEFIYLIGSPFFNQPTTFESSLFVFMSAIGVSSILYNFALKPNNTREEDQ
ncbi:MAG: hypothetical protein NUV67_04970 [archaeon]|nr:hypothetical protein [archaeon]